MSHKHRRFTADEDAFLIETHRTQSASEQANALHRSYKSIVNRRWCLFKQGKITKTTRAKNTQWSADDAALLELMLQKGSSVTKIAGKLRRSRDAIYSYLHSQQITVKGIRKAGYVNTAIDVARLFGVHPSVVFKWIDRGWLKARRNKARGVKVRHPSPHFLITDDDVQVFVENRSFWPAWEPQSMTDAAWREYAEDVRRTAGGEWLTTEYIAQRWHWSKNTIRRYCKLGKLSSIVLNRTYYVWSADLREPVDRRFKEAA